MCDLDQSDHGRPPALKLNVSCRCSMDHLCHAYELVHSFSIITFTSLVTDEWMTSREHYVSTCQSGIKTAQHMATLHDEVQYRKWKSNFTQMVLRMTPPLHQASSDLKLRALASQLLWCQPEVIKFVRQFLKNRAAKRDFCDLFRPRVTFILTSWPPKVGRFMPLRSG